MDKLKKIEQLKVLKDNGSLTEEEFKKEKERLLNNTSNSNKGTKKIIIMIVISLLIIVAVISCIIIITSKKSNQSQETPVDSDDSGFTQASSNVYNEVSFSNIQPDDENLNDTQQKIIKYFDSDYFWYTSSVAQIYPQIFKGSKIISNSAVLKVLKSTDEEFQVLAVDVGYALYDYGYTSVDISAVPEQQLMVISGKQLNRRLTRGDIITTCGRYNSIDSYDIDGKNYVLPSITAINIIPSSNGTSEYRYNLDIVKPVAEYIFGKDIKITQPEDGYYNVTLDNQSNSNFKSFDMSRMYSSITYNRKDNNLSENVSKELYISSDFSHYIVTTYDSVAKHIYIEYFDKEFNKIWSREFDFANNENNLALDYNSKKIAFTIDNELYLVDTKNGENIIEPVLVGEKTSLSLLSDGIILIGRRQKDTIMKVDYSGKIIFRTNVDAPDLIDDYSQSTIQIRDSKLVVFLYSVENDGTQWPCAKYAIVNSDGEIESVTDSIELEN